MPIALLTPCHPWLLETLLADTCQDYFSAGLLSTATTQHSYHSAQLPLSTATTQHSHYSAQLPLSTATTQHSYHSAQLLLSTLLCSCREAPYWSVLYALLTFLKTPLLLFWHPLTAHTCADMGKPAIYGTILTSFDC